MSEQHTLPLVFVNSFCVAGITVIYLTLSAIAPTTTEQGTAPQLLFRGVMQPHTAKDLGETLSRVAFEMTREGNGP